MRAIRLVPLVIVTGLLAGWAGGAMANHDFPDVNPGSAFHDDITTFTNAGCATGFPDGTYHPTEPVNRQQAARFFSQCAGRAATDTAEDVVLSSVPPATTVVNVSAVAGGVAQSGGVGTFLIMATFEISSSSTTGGDYPCSVEFTLTDKGGNFTSTRELDLPANTAADDENTSGAITALATADVVAGETSFFILEAQKDACAAPVTADGEVTALYVPFDANP